MNTFEKIKKSWWVILSFIMFLNGFGFIYIGTKHNNKNWILEGIIYELPWFLYIIIVARYGVINIPNPSALMVLLAVLLLFISIIRSVWVAVKLGDVYDNNEKYTIQTTVLDNHKTTQNDSNSKSKIGCCLCILVIFLIFVMIAL